MVKGERASHLNKADEGAVIRSATKVVGVELLCQRQVVEGGAALERHHRRVRRNHEVLDVVRRHRSCRHRCHGDAVAAQLAEGLKPAQTKNSEIYFLCQ